jgi:hypothetical protein
VERGCAAKAARMIPAVSSASARLSGRNEISSMLRTRSVVMLVESQRLARGSTPDDSRGLCASGEGRTTGKELLVAARVQLATYSFVISLSAGASFSPRSLAKSRQAR